MTAAHRVVVTAGHVDHGKSTLVRTLTGMEPDRLGEERRRGLTIELGFAWTALPAPSPTPAAAPGTAASGDGGSVTVAFVDVPGHERFVGTMLAGAGPAPAALLVVAADDGWSAQTAEHVDALDLLEVPALAVAITKADAVTAERVAAVTEDVTARLADTSLAGAPIQALDGRDPAAVAQLGRVLAAQLAALPAAADLGRPRLWVDRAFTISGAGTVVTGTLRDGALRVGDRLEVLPGGHDVRARDLRCLGVDVEVAGPGTRVACNLVGIDLDEVARGDAVVGGGPWQVTAEVDAVLRATRDGAGVDRSGAWRVHVGSASANAHVLPLTEPIAPGTEGVVRVTFDRALPVVAGDGLILREAGRRATVAGGRIADPAPPQARPRGRAARRARAELLETVAAAPAPSDRVIALLRAAGGSLPAADALARAGLARDAPRPREVTVLAGHAVTAEAVTAWSATAAARVADGAVRDTELADALRAAGVPDALLAPLVDRLVADGRLARAGAELVAPETAGAAARTQRSAEAALLDALRVAPLAPPDLTTTARELGLDHRAVTTLVHAGAIVRCGDIAFAAEAVHLAVDRLETLAAEVGPFTASQAKTTWDTTRRYAIPLLEHLDQTGVTRFDGRLRALTGHRPGALHPGASRP